jgi:hypothetical protein
MRKLMCLCIALVAACGAGAFKDQARDAMPDSSGVQMKTPSNSSSQMQSSSDSSAQALTSANASDWYKVTVAYAAAVNFGTVWTLGIVEAVVANEPTTCTSDSCTWGPGSGALDPLTYQLVVKKSADTFDWELDAQPKSAPSSAFVKLISGNAIPSGIRHRGSGTFTIDLDAAATLPGHATDQGKIVIAYSNIGPAHVEAHFNGVKDSNPNHSGQLGNAYYNYQENASGGGDLEIAWHNLTSDERDDIHSRWKVDGSGRADVQVVQTGAMGQFSECWDTAANGFVTTFNPNVGVEAACSIAGAQFGANINLAP